MGPKTLFIKAPILSSLSRDTHSCMGFFWYFCSIKPRKPYSLFSGARIIPSIPNHGGPIFHLLQGSSPEDRGVGISGEFPALRRVKGLRLGAHGALGFGVEAVGF